MKYESIEDTPLGKLVKQLEALPRIESPTEPQGWGETVQVAAPVANRIAVYIHEGNIVMESRDEGLTYSITTMDKSEALHLAEAILEVETAVREERPVSQKYPDGFILIMNNVGR
jgi:hypothetical protein